MLNSLKLYEKSRSLKCNISASCGPILMNKTSFFSYGCVESDKKNLGTVGAKGGKSKTSCIYSSAVYDKFFFFWIVREDLRHGPLYYRGVMIFIFKSKTNEINRPSTTNAPLLNLTWNYIINRIIVPWNYNSYGVETTENWEFLGTPKFSQIPLSVPKCSRCT